MGELFKISNLAIYTSKFYKPHFFRMYGTRRSAGKRIRMDENQDYEQQGYGGYQEEQDSSMDQSNESYDPLAFYRQQQAAMMMESTQHVQASQQEIQKAQLEAQQREQMQHSTMEGGGRRSRSAAAAAKAAMSMLHEERDTEVPVQAASPVASPARGRKRAGGNLSFGIGSRRGRPAGNFICSRHIF